MALPRIISMRKGTNKRIFKPKFSLVTKCSYLIIQKFIFIDKTLQNKISEFFIKISKNINKIL